MIDLNAIKIQIEKINPSFIFKGGDKIDQLVNMRDFNYTPIVLLLPPDNQNPDLISNEIRKLSRQKGHFKRNDIASITISPYLGIVMSPELTGTRVNFELAITNKVGHPIVIKGVNAVLNNEPLHFKSFFKVNADNSREPDFSTRFPIIVNSKGSGTLSVVLENFSKWSITEGRLEGELHVLLGDKKVAREKYFLTVDSAMTKTLKGLSEVASKNNVAIVFDAMIES